MDASGTVYIDCEGCKRPVAAHDARCHNCGKERDPQEAVRPMLDCLRDALLDGVPDPLAAMRDQLIQGDEDKR